MKEYNFKIGGTEYSVYIKSVKNNVASLSVNGTEYEVEVEGIKTVPTRAVSKGIQQPPAMQSTEPVVKPTSHSGTATQLKSPLPGVILDVRVKEGDEVKAGQTVMILEAMKMENNIEADRDGVIERITARKGDPVLEGDVLLSIK
ncbi:MAG: biotin/lipoyl-binding protein [Rikenellaceae bacterium]|nr:biotin/lipoyl-binding protein [Rikenellaceae bacterium]MCL2693075.1 biotin/lipoyl-binding protein [Rikenellaceae bacterium]